MKVNEPKVLLYPRLGGPTGPAPRTPAWAADRVSVSDAGRMLAVLPAGQRAEIDRLKRIDARESGGQSGTDRAGRARAGGASACHRALRRRLERAARDYPRRKKSQPAQMLYHPLFSRKYSDVSSGLWIFLLEAGVALAILAFIVWWTLPRKPKSGERALERPGQDEAPGRH